MSLTSLNNKSKILKQISLSRLASEDTIVHDLLNMATKINYDHEETSKIAKDLIIKAKEEPGNVNIEEFFKEYSLDTDAGVAVMSLFEALIRTADNKTANLLIEDHLKRLRSTKSSKNSKASQSSNNFFKASKAALEVASYLVNSNKTISKLSDPVLREAMKKAIKIVGDHFIMGETIGKALKSAVKYEALDYRMSYDMLGEGARSNEQALTYLQNYLSGTNLVASLLKDKKNIYERPSISVKLSALYERYKLTNKQAVFTILLPRLKEICLLADSFGISVTIDAEEADRLELSLELFENLMKSKDMVNVKSVGMAVQAYNKSAVYVIEYLCFLAKKYNKTIPVRLVKGAYFDTEIKRAQIAGLKTYPVFTTKAHTDISYLICTYKMLQNPDLIYPQFATHNALTIASIITMAKKLGTNFELQKLHGMGSAIYKHLVKNYPSRIYAPVGSYKELLPYLIRRILENGASTSFVRKLIDDKVSIEELITNPLDLVKINMKNIDKNIDKKTLPKIKLPPNLYAPKRTNSLGFDLGSNSDLLLLKTMVEKHQNKKFAAAPLINGKTYKGKDTNVYSVYDRLKKIGYVVNSDNKHVDLALNVTEQGSKKWSQSSVTERVLIISKFVKLLERNQDKLLAISALEAGKIIPDTIGEIREAIDFCNYYSVCATELFTNATVLTGPTGETNQLSLHPKGVVVCISPWNFPLSIFIGQVVAALLCGNSVIAKPAEQTPLIAFFVCNLLLEAGLPKNALSLLPGDGPTLGKILCHDKRVKAIAFTGSLQAASSIARELSNRNHDIIPLIAETGGVNAMIVDSTAHIEQVIDDIVTSAFLSAGQRCSALRLLYVQDDIFDNLITTLKGAITSLKLGSPLALDTDIGPIIDQEAYNRLMAYITKARKKFKIIAGQDNSCEGGNLLAPIVFLIDKISDIEGEIFGPVLHVIKYKTDDFTKVIDDINDLGYGLTIGLATRISERIDYLRNHAKVGNIYINRSMVGAVVGVQPFGGEGLSGTGPKAGGPNYLGRFVTERSYSENTAAIGGNRELLLLG